MTTLEAAGDLLGLIGFEELSHAPSGVETRIISDINATLQKLFTMGLPWWSEVSSGGVLFAPMPVTGLTLTNGSKDFTGTLASWMVGCTVRLEGDANDNQFTSATTLARPYVGSPSGNGTVFCDSITLPAEVSSIVSPVVVVGECELVPLRGKGDLRTWGHIGYRRPTHGLPPIYMGANLVISQPSGYYIENATVESKFVLRLRVVPLPDRQYSLTWDEKHKPQRITALNDTDLIIPGEFYESIFLPLLRKQFSTWKHFEGDVTLINEQYEDAFSLLAKLKPQPARLGRVATDVENR